MKTSYFLPITLTLLFAFVIVHVTAIFYIANNTELEGAKNVYHPTVRISGSHFTNINNIASQPLAIN